MRRHHILLFILLAFVLAFGSSAYLWHDFRSPGPLTAEKTVLIPRGAGFRGAVEQLAEGGVIRYPLVFSAQAFVTGRHRALKAGEYAFAAGASPEAVMEKLTSGDVVVHKVTVPEGLRSAEIAALLAGDARLTGDFPALPDGALLPETYHYLHGDARAQIAARMQADMNKTLAELWKGRKEGLPLTTPEQALVLASIVEKETGVDGERGRVAAVFINRLKLGMKLQSDPTTIYAIEKEKGPLGRALLTADLAYDSPYNTYAYAGLPPGPICNPGRAALEATLNPPDTKELYFVATGSGGHHFAETLAAHNDNVRQYREAMKAVATPPSSPGSGH